MGKYFAYYFMLLILTSCEGLDNNGLDINNEPDPATCGTPITSSGLLYSINDADFLWAGEDSTTHFNISIH